MPRVIVVTESMHNTDQGGQQVHIPEGEYLLQIDRIVPCTEKFYEDPEKNPWMSVRTQIVDGPVKSRPYSELLTWSPTGQFRMGRFLAAFNISRLPEGTELDYPKFSRYAAALTKTLSGKQIGVFIADNDYQGKVSSQVMEFYPAADYADRKGAGAVMAAAAPNGTETAPAASGPNPMAVFENALVDLLPQPEGA